ncbi:MAG: hypothetical protein AAF242_11515, partial [Bacteroidota bacterium]
MKHLSYIIAFIIPISGLSQRDLSQTLVQYRKTFLPEKVFVHTDKNIYAVGETIWMALYLADGQTHEP